MATRAASDTDPWDEGCTVQPYIGGLATMSAIAADLETVIGNATAGQDNGYVFISDWRFNPLRDLGGGPNYTAWSSPATTTVDKDETAIGLVLRLMQAGVQVWMLLWYPTSNQNIPAFHSHVAEHRYVAAVVGAENARLQQTSATTFGVVALDMRVADNGRAALGASHHQKFFLIRSGGIHRAYLGGVDLAFTRRDAPVGSGDWQSATAMPPISGGWPHQGTGVDYTTPARVVAPVATDNPGTDLPVTIYGQTSQVWHDRHLCLEGPIVQTLDSHFRERWTDIAGHNGADMVALTFAQSGSLTTSSATLDANWGQGCVLMSSADGLPPNALPAQPSTVVSTVPMVTPPPGQPAASSGQSIVQMWRTTPLRLSRGTQQSYFQYGEFTVVDGLVTAVNQANQLIWIFDQYFWSRPLARLLNQRLTASPSLYVIVVLPPHADGADPDDSVARAQHAARYLALTDLVNGAAGNRVNVYSMWQATAGGSGGQGIYVHAKSHIYDATLFVTGSANLNRRSLTGDSELVCAVLDQTLAQSVMTSLWNALLPAASPSPFPLNLGTNNWGQAFFNAFAQAAPASATAVTPSTKALVYADPPRHRQRLRNCRTSSLGICQAGGTPSTGCRIGTTGFSSRPPSIIRASSPTLPR